jgi:fermentation-respiration switch protein FrsA (DUF1100 family)
MGSSAGGLIDGQGGAGHRHFGTRLWRTLVVAGRIVGPLVLAVSAAMVVLTRWLAGQFLTLAPERRRPLLERPEDFGLASEDVQVVSEDGLELHGWYMAGRNGATIMVQHGSPGGRQDGLVEAAFLSKHGYNVLLGSFRAHDDCDGVDVSFGYHEMKDTAAWHNYLLGREEVDPERIGIFGESMGGSVAIRYAAANKSIAAVATASAPAIMSESVELMIVSDVHAPRWSVPPLASLFIFWAGRKAGCTAADVDPLPHVAQISPRPLLIIHGGDENRVPPEHAHMLYEAAGKPKELWFVEEAGHVNFELFRPEEYAQRVVGFFDRALIKERAAD